MGVFQLVDWMIAWRHLRAAEGSPAWVWSLLVGALYLIALGGGLALYAVHLAEIADAGAEALAPPTPGDDLGPTSLQFYFGAFGGITLLVGVMTLIFCVLALSFNLLPTIIAMSVLLGCMALVVVLSLMSGLEGDMRDKILAQKAHIRVARADGRPFEDYLSLTDALAKTQGITGASPYLEGEIMVRSRLNRQGAILSGIVPPLHSTASNLASLVREGDYRYLEAPQEIPDPDPFAIESDSTPWRLRHLEKKKDGTQAKDDAPVAVELPPPQPLGAASADGGVGPVGALNKLPPPPRTADTPVTAVAVEDDDGWEVPAVELGRSPRSPMPAAPPVVEPEDDGWEVPAVELGLAPRTEQAKPDATAAPGPDPDVRPLEPASDGSVTDNPVLIGSELAMELGIGLGTEVQLITPVGRMTPAGRMPGMLLAKVGGVFFSGMYEYDRKNVYVPLAVAQRFLLAGDRVSGIEVKLTDVDAIDEGNALVESVVAAAGRSDELIVEDWRDLNRNLFSAMFLEKVAMFIALLFVVLVASFGILASNLMSVMEKSKEIAILKAMGTSDRGILRVFVAEGLCVGILGSAGGIATGLGLCWALYEFGLPIPVYYVEKLPVDTNGVEVALVGTAALVIVCLSSLYPALLASRLRPVDALRQAEQ
jgi:lipoprotein-releasing system permease protein